MLDENSSLIKTISEYQNMGRHQESMNYQVCRWWLPAVLLIRIRTDPHLKSPPGSGFAWTDADPDPEGKKA